MAAHAGARVVSAARRESARSFADRADAHNDRGDMSLAVQQLAAGLRVLATDEPPSVAYGLRAPVEADASFRPLDRAPRRPSVRVQRNTRPVPCSDCGPDVSPHDADLWLIWGEGSARQTRAVCVVRAGVFQLNAIAQIESAAKEPVL